MYSTFKGCGLIFCVVLTATLLSLRVSNDRITVIKTVLLNQSDSLIATVRLLQEASEVPANTRLLQHHFLNVRLAYKRLEWATEYFDPLTTRQVNGPPVPEAELNGIIIQPDGLQVIEAELFPHYVPASGKVLKRLLDRLLNNALEYKRYFEKANLEDWQILDAIKLEIFRVEALGLNDFDDPLLMNCFGESAAALQSVAEISQLYDSSIDFTPAIRYLYRPVVFNRFDRAAFILGYVNPLTRQLTKLQRRLKLPDVRYNRLLNQYAATLFDRDAFNRNAFTAAPGDSATNEKITLGKRLFFDPILSGAMNRSCATCHQPDNAFTDGLVKSLDITGKKTIARNTPTLINAALQPAQFYDLRAASLEDQANDVVQNQEEMHGDMKIATGRLWQTDTYRRLFSEAYPQRQRMAIDTFEVMNALASYVRSLTALNSRFDNYMLGDRTALSGIEVSGFNLFMGKAKCSTCHYLPLFNGALVPRYMQMEAEVIGVPLKKNSKQIDADPGTGGIQELGFNRHAFKVTTVRNAGRTAPYMHNGVFKTLDEVVDFYNKGGGAGMGLKIPNQTLPNVRLHLTVKEKNELIAFIKSLNSR